MQNFHRFHLAIGYVFWLLYLSSLFDYVLLDLFKYIEIMMFQDYAASRLKNYMYLKEKFLTSGSPVSDGSLKRKSMDID